MRNTAIAPAKVRERWLVLATPLIVLLTHTVAVLPHEFMHSIMAWRVGIKGSPGSIDWGGGSLLNILLQININENVDYEVALDAGKYWQVALTAFAGPGIANGGLYLLLRKFLTRPSLSVRPTVAYVLFWFLLMNLANLYDYVPIRTFAADGDVAHFRWGSGISPWPIFAIAGYLVLWAIIDFYRVIVPKILRVVGFDSPLARAVVLILATVLLFGYFAIPGLEESDPVSLFIARTSLLIIPTVIAANWQRIVLRKGVAA